jgi:hypothetical protein
MKHCATELIGIDRATHTVTLEAESLFDAANQAIQNWPTVRIAPGRHFLLELRNGRGRTICLEASSLAQSRLRERQ